MPPLGQLPQRLLARRLHPLLGRRDGGGALLRRRRGALGLLEGHPHQHAALTRGADCALAGRGEFGGDLSWHVLPAPFRRALPALPPLEQLERISRAGSRTIRPLSPRALRADRVRPARPQASCRHAVDRGVHRRARKPQVHLLLLGEVPLVPRRHGGPFGAKGRVGRLAIERISAAQPSGERVYANKGAAQVGWRSEGPLPVSASRCGDFDPHPSAVAQRPTALRLGRHFVCGVQAGPVAARWHRARDFPREPPRGRRADLAPSGGDLREIVEVRRARRAGRRFCAAARD
mmetsp:Transcript_40341/g.97866  ORF Transcript_40341/g.97866 Transcript_40341/m.97866 type:complete len:291 (+) Transcript_40341:2581-3453(+)